jgi:hypothetical protein
MVLTSEGKPLWDGKVEIVARAATLAEKALTEVKALK